MTEQKRAQRVKGSKQTKKSTSKPGKTIIKKNRNLSKFLPYILLILVTFIAFSSILNNDFVSLDDTRFIINNEEIRSIDNEGLKVIFSAMDYSPFYKPLVFLSWAVEYHFFGINPRVNHVNNLLLHILNTLLIYIIILLILKKLFPKENKNHIYAFFIALLWAVHPLRVESVSWATERKDVLYSFFFLTSLLCYLKYLEKKKYWLILIGVVLYFLGILSKSMIIILPLILFIPDYLFKRKFSYKIFLEKVPYFIVLIIGLYLYGIFQEFEYYTAGVSSGVIESSLEGEAIQDHLFFSKNAFVKKIIFISYRLVTWGGKIIYPHDLAILYPVPVFLSETALPARLFLYPAILLVIGGIALYSHKKTRIIISGLLFSALTVAPVLGMRGHESSLINDRYTYMSSLGLIFIFIMGIKRVIDKKPKFKPVIYGFLIILTVIYAVSTAKQNKVWGNNFALWNNVIDKYPDFSFGYFYRGNTLFRLGKDNLQHALKDYNKAIELEDDHAEFYRNRGSAKYNSGDIKGAIIDFSKAIEMIPDYAGAYMDRGGAKARLKVKDLEGALADVSRAIEIAPEYWDAYYRRGVIRRMTGDHAGAINDFDVYIHQNKNNHVAFLHRGLSKNVLGYTEEACQDWKRSQALGNNQAKVMFDRYCK